MALEAPVITVFLLICLSPPVTADTKVYNFQVVNSAVRRLGTTKTIVTVNGEFPGPTIYANDGDRLLITLTNNVHYKMSIHWHGVRQKRTPWFDGPAFVTQCPLREGQSFLYNFTVEQHMGTLFWHAHIMWLRGTVYGAIVIYPKPPSSYPFKTPDDEHVILLGEWYKKDVQAIEEDALRTGLPELTDSYTINGYPGPMYPTSEPGDVYNLTVIAGKTYLLRIINAALNTQLFFSIANHNMTVVEMDANYNKPYSTQTVFLAAGQSCSVLITADQPCGQYFMSAQPYSSTGAGVPYTPTPARGLLAYRSCSLTSRQPMEPHQPADNDTPYATVFSNSIRSLKEARVPLTVDREYFLTVGFDLRPCKPPGVCKGLGNFTASMNNLSFTLPRVSLMQAYYYNISGVFTTDFPEKPERPFDYTGAPSPPFGGGVSGSPKEGTRISVIPFGSNVQLVFQNTNIFGFESHPMHLHGYNFYVLAYGFGNYDPEKVTFNLVDPPLMNTVGVPRGGWTVVRFTADNPGIWYVHCHLEMHTTWGLSTAFLVRNGEGVDQSIVPPPNDFPKCDEEESIAHVASAALISTARLLLLVVFMILYQVLCEDDYIFND